MENERFIYGLDIVHRIHLHFILFLGQLFSSTEDGLTYLCSIYTLHYAVCSISLVHYMWLSYRYKDKICIKLQKLIIYV